MHITHCKQSKRKIICHNAYHSIHINDIEIPLHLLANYNVSSQFHLLWIPACCLNINVYKSSSSFCIRLLQIFHNFHGKLLPNTIKWMTIYNSFCMLFILLCIMNIWFSINIVFGRKERWKICSLLHSIFILFSIFSFILFLYFIVL